MADKAHQMTDAMLEDLEIRIADEYAIASRDMQKKLRDYFDKFNEQEAEQKKLLEAEKITQQDYNNWRFRHEAMGERWEEMKDILAADLENAQNIALKMSGEKMPDVYALNANYGTYQIEHDGRIDTGFTLYNHDTAEYLLKDTRQLMPGPSTRKAKEIAANEAMQWNKQKIQSAVLQGILQGESPYKVAERLGSVATMNYNASVRYARTMTTSAQNAGRYESFHRAKDLGVDLTIEWQATLDNRTRHDHRLMHGQRTEVDKPFHTPDGFTIYYPADCTGESNAPQKEIWNCRCTLLAWVKGFEGETVKSSPKMGDMTFEEWQNEKAKEEIKPQSQYNQTKVDHQIKETPPMNEYQYWSEAETQKRFDAIKEQTGYSDEKAQETLIAFSGDRREYRGVEYNTPEGWFYKADTRIRKLDGDKWSEAAKTIDDYIQAAPKYDGSIYRGLSLDGNKLAELKKGGIFQDNGSLSSWTSSLDVAEMFAAGRTEEYGLNPIVIETVSHPYSSPVAHLSLFGSDENEVIVSNMHGNQYNIDSVEEINGITFVKLIFGG